MSDITITIEGQAFDFDDFSLGELEWFEEFTGKTVDTPGALSSMKAAVAFVYLVRKRENPDFTVEEARSVKLSALDAPPEKPAAKKRPTKPAAT